MKIGLVCPYNIFSGGGVQECVKALQKELEARGHQALIITPAPRQRSTKRLHGVLFIGNGMTVKALFHTTAQGSVTVNPKEVDEMLEREKFDILHFHEPWVPIVSRQILTRSKSKNIATFHAKLPETVMTRTIERVITPYTKSIMKYFDVLTAVSDAAAEYAQTLSHKKLHIVPNGINVETYASCKHEDKPGTQKTILYIGRLERRKGVKYLLQAYAHISAASPDTRLLIAGDGPERIKLEELSRSLQLKRVQFLGYVSEAKKCALLKKADLFCAPSLFGESFGIVLLEALAAGVPVVAGDNPGYTSVLQGRGQLSLVNPKDTKEFARRINLLLYDEEIRQSWRAWAASHVQQFSYSHVIDAYEALYASRSKVR